MGEDEPVTVGSSSSGIDSSNIEFQLLKKQGWTQGTGLGASQQGRLEPVKAYLKDNKRGLGADTSRNKFFPVSENSDSSGNYEKEEEGMGKGVVASSCSSIAINPSNIGFQLLKKHGWKEGTGLGISEQGRIEPVQAYLKNNKRGLGADKLQKALNPPDSTALNKKNDQELHSKKGKGLSKKMKKEQELEKRLQEREFERAFYREFWPDNV
ncbi:G patch domain-containing protein 8 isoform X2 [Prunus yedoensis var. nudiflora]|uniref:G patch domain-containing protein 8 isoform X2 n=1 Tax=Prunus yedoensis var. nudiflora TaxID=2094558 RepID=A0A314Y3F8_PRUYE|nr:G patch domain-containing protein 8 isoform X2 [Prunus yedoensis var. nudiflora]